MTSRAVSACTSIMSTGSFLPRYRCLWPVFRLNATLHVGCFLLKVAMNVPLDIGMPPVHSTASATYPTTHDNVVSNGSLLAAFSIYGVDEPAASR